jgi:hypothetical protein
MEGAVASGNQQHASIEDEAPAIGIYGNTTGRCDESCETGSSEGQPFTAAVLFVSKQGGKRSLVAHQTTRIP